ncbi:MAG: alpha/beta hydrolase-fold protein [Balneolaceae bacterium]|nr:alpha/beta hydrolase-fold protein [Balneolaceae bacterium]
MKRTNKKWRSPSLGKDMELLIYGESGTPILAIPTRGKSIDQFEEKGLVDTISFQIENGFNQLFCIESDDDKSFLNESIAPEKRILRHQQYESYVIDEVVPFIHDNASVEYLILAGFDTGGYHAINLALKHPTEVGKAIGISGIYDIRALMNGYFDDNVYYNSPIDYVPNLNNQAMLEKIRKVDFRLVSYSNDPKKDDAYRLAHIFQTKVIEHELDVWDKEGKSEGEWDLWNEMLKVHIV